MALTTYTAGEVLTAASLNDNLAYAVTVPAAVPGGLTLISATTIGTTVSSVTVTGAFSATYDNYRIKITGVVGSAAADTTFQLSGITTSVYAFSGFYQSIGTSSIVAFGGTTTHTPIGTLGTTLNTQINIDLSSPNLAVAKYLDIATCSDNIRVNQATQCNSTVQATGFTITPDSGTFTGGTIRVYGYANS